MSNGVGMGSIVIGCSLLVLTLISVICGAVTVNKITAQAEAAASVGLWSLYVSVSIFLRSKLTIIVELCSCKHTYWYTWPVI